MQKSTHFYELIVRMSVPGSHIQGMAARFLDRVTDGETVVAEQIGIAQPSNVTHLATLLSRADLANIVSVFQAELDGRPEGEAPIDAPTVPEALTGFVLVDEPPADTRARLLARWQELTHMLQMGLATSEQAAEHTLLSAHQSWLTS